jgi:hypothetical protein
MEVLRDGTFVDIIDGQSLGRGIRPSMRAPRNSKFLVKSQGAVGLDGVLQVIDDLELSRIDTSLDITDAFPYPQVFTFINVVLICGRQDIYEYDGTLNHMLGPVTAGSLWSAVDFFDFIYLTNGSVGVVRSANTGLYSLTTDYPIGESVCNFNGQALVGGVSE